MSHDEATFRELARHGQALKLVSQPEVDLICRRGTRKQAFWTRHLRDLLSVLADRLAKVTEEEWNDHFENLQQAMETSQRQLALEG